MNFKRFRHQILQMCLIFFLLAGLSVPVHAAPGAPLQATDVVLPRTQTLYFNGLQWGPVYGWNPYSSDNNNSMAISQSASARVPVFETPYINNMLDGQQYPLLADGPWSWNVARTELTFHLKTAAKWRDGTSVTAEDVAYTWASNVKYETSAGFAYQAYIDTITAVDPHTVLVKATLDGGGNAINPMMVSAYLSENYVVQKAWTQTLEARSGADPIIFKADPADDFMSSGPYTKYYADDTKVVLIRNDGYWGKDASMWGRLPTPKYLAHIIYADNAAGNAAFKAAQVDVSQQFIPNVQNLWLVDHLPISTYLPDAPYGIGASLPTAFYNLDSYGLDQVAVRKAIAMAVDYDAIIANAMTNQSPTFSQVPRSLMNPTSYEQGMYNPADVAGLQWAGNDIDGAKALLDAASITDTDADGWREYNHQKLVYVATAPNGWSDWQAAIELVAAAGRAIGIDVTTAYPEWSDYQAAVTNWPLPTAGYDIFMMWSDASGPTQPWGRIRHLIGGEFAGSINNYYGNWGGYISPAADTLIQAIPGITDPDILKTDYTELTRIYLTDVPSFTVMYRPDQFHTVNETFWTGFPKSTDGTNPPVPPLDLINGYSIAGLYNLNDSPTVASILRVNASPTSAATVQFTINFSEAVNGVDPADFSFTKTGTLAGASVVSVTGANKTYTVTVNTGTGSGNLRLDVPASATITDLFGKSFAGPAYTGGQIYLVDKIAPKVTSITRLDPNPSTAASLRFNVIFSEAVTGGIVSDFNLTASGITGAAVTSVTGSGASRVVTVSTGTGFGTLRLNVLDYDRIKDVAGNPLGGAGIGNGNFVTGPKYTLDRNNTFTTTAAVDGWVLETSETSGLGGTLNAVSSLLVGDDVLNRQYRSILYFNTLALPDNATIVKVTLKVRKGSVLGTDPFTTHGALLADIQKGFFGTSAALQALDFQALASKTTAGAFSAVSGAPGWYQMILNPAYYPYVNKLGPTQFRLRFALDDNNDKGADYASFYAGEAAATLRPVLVVQYTLP
jgi:peptide/nickel transport system substrate-binding protein